MAPVGTLWGVAYQPQTKIILTVAALSGLELEQPEFDFSNKPAKFTAKFPYGKIPAFEGLDGFKLIESMPIARYLARLGTNAKLLGSTTKETALIEQWIHFAEQEIGEPGRSIMGMIFGYSGPFNREILDKHTERLVRALKYVESYLAERSSGYLASDFMTLADIVLAGMVCNCSYLTLGAAERAQYPGVFAHFAKVTADARVKQFWGTEKFTEVAVTEPRPLSRP